MPPKAIPDRWIPYKACGEVIQGTRFICFKVPLKWSVQKNVREIEKIWDIPTVLAEIPKLGAVIDLTNTARYYNPEDFLKANISHKKILMPGRIIPPESAVREFMKAVDEFLGKDGESLVGVHCTHGLNRTGYMVCRYMRDRLGIPAQEAITRFQVARGYEIERNNYINDLLGSHRQTAYEGKETEIKPVDNRRNDVTYRSPLGEDRYSPTADNSKRFGNIRSNNDRYGYNKFSSDRNASSKDKGSVRNDGLFSCYTNRYNNKGNDLTKFSSDRNASSRDKGSVRNDGLFSCYTNRYNNKGNDLTSRSRNDKGRKPGGSPLSWRKKGESSTHSSPQRNKNDDNSGYYRNRYEDRSRNNEK